MKPTATLINIARGGIVNDAAWRSLESRRDCCRRFWMCLKANPLVHRTVECAQCGANASHRQCYPADTFGYGAVATDNLIGFFLHGKPVTPLNPQVLVKIGQSGMPNRPERQFKSSEHPWRSWRQYQVPMTVCYILCSFRRSRYKG